MIVLVVCMAVSARRSRNMKLLKTFIVVPALPPGRTADPARVCAIFLRLQAGAVRTLPADLFWGPLVGASVQVLELVTFVGQAAQRGVPRTTTQELEIERINEVLQMNVRTMEQERT